MIARVLARAALRVFCCLFLWQTLFVAAAQDVRAVVRDDWRKAQLDSFELIWRTLRDRYWDPGMSGIDWSQVHARYLQKLSAAKDASEAEDLLDRMIHELPSSHLSIIPAALYRPHTGARSSQRPGANEEPDAFDEGDDVSGSTGLTVTVIGGSVVVERVENSSAAMAACIRPGWILESVDDAPVSDIFAKLRAAHVPMKRMLVEQIIRGWLSGPLGGAVHLTLRKENGSIGTFALVRQRVPGKLVQFGNLPPEHVSIEHRQLANGVGYIRLNPFLDPVTVMPELETAIAEFKHAPGIVLDLRNNPGGLGIMAMGIAGWFETRKGLRLGKMISRDSTVDFEINPRMQAYAGRLAILVNGGSASTAEILAQGLQDLGRARIFGTRTAGAALPSEIIGLPDGDRFQYPEATYISAKGRVLEGNGVQPDVVVAPTVKALLAGRDLALEAASAWARR